MADYGHDPTETVAAFDAFKEAGFKVDVATETGRKPECDQKMLRGWTQKLLGATADVVRRTDAMTSSEEFAEPLSWTDASFGLTDYAVVWLPGGHDKGVRQLIESETAQDHIARYVQLCRKDKQQSNAKRCLAAICHGPMLLCFAKDPQTGKSVIHQASVTALPAFFESAIYHATRLVLGDYYKTFGAGSENVEESIRKVLKDDKTQYKSSLSAKPLVLALVNRLT